MAPGPKWHDKAIEALEAIALFNPGALSYAIGEDGYSLAVAPSLIESEKDEEHAILFAPYAVDVGQLIEVFDGPRASAGRRTRSHGCCSKGP